MSKKTFHISLKGYVGGEDFDRRAVDAVLAENEGKPVEVLIDSLGGSLATGMSISAAFKNHGKVNVHFVGLNASAATMASLGAAHISIDAGAMYLVHKCSMEFFEWGSLNADQFSQLIADCEKVKADLDKIDQNCARLYAARCKRKPEELLELMKVGGWLTPQEALEWGFVDEITDYCEDAAACMTDALASAMSSQGMPIPNLPLAGKPESGIGNSAFTRFLNALTNFFNLNKKSHNLMPTDTPSPKTYSEQEYQSLHRQLTEQQNLVADLEAKLAKMPAEDSKMVVENSKELSKAEPLSDAEQYCRTVNSARKLFNSI